MLSITYVISNAFPNSASVGLFDLEAAFDNERNEFADVFGYAILNAYFSELSSFIKRRKTMAAPCEIPIVMQHLHNGHFTFHYICNGEWYSLERGGQIKPAQEKLAWFEV